MPGRLIEQHLQLPGTAHVLGPATVAIGRDEANDIVVVAEYVSRRHAELRWDGARHVLHTTGKNGLFVNGGRLAGPHPLAHGDIISFPGVAGMRLIFVDREETPTWSPPESAPAPLRIDTTAGAVTLQGRHVRLGPKENRALMLLARRRGEVVSRDELDAEVWPERPGDVSDSDRSHLIGRLRQKVEPDPAHPRYVVTVAGLGYRLDPH